MGVGFVDVQNVAIEQNWAEGQFDRLALATGWPAAYAKLSIPVTQRDGPAGIARKPSDDPSIAAILLHRSEGPVCAITGH
jgi:hypothetical protein